PFRADVHGVAFRAMASAILGPFHGDRNPGIQPNSRADMLHPFLEIANDRLHELLGIRPRPPAWHKTSAHKPQSRTKLAVTKDYGGLVPGTMDLTSRASEK